MLCPACMEEHEDKLVTYRESMVYKGKLIEYDAEYHYCCLAHVTYADEEQLTRNWESMKKAYREIGSEEEGAIGSDT